LAKYDIENDAYKIKEMEKYFVFSAYKESGTLP
jgi:hypothetical protein